jgi:hypothetical protein
MFTFVLTFHLLLPCFHKLCVVSSSHVLRYACAFIRIYMFVDVKRGEGEGGIYIMLFCIYSV